MSIEWKNARLRFTLTGAREKTYLDGIRAKHLRLIATWLANTAAKKL